MPSVTGARFGRQVVTKLFANVSLIKILHSMKIALNSLWPGDATWWHIYRSTLDNITWTNIDLYNPKGVRRQIMRLRLLTLLTGTNELNSAILLSLIMLLKIFRHFTVILVQGDYSAHLMPVLYIYRTKTWSSVDQQMSCHQATRWRHQI